MALEVLTGFDGSCPHYPQGVRRLSRNRFLLFPSHRKRPGESEEGKGSGSRLSTRIRNSGRRPVKVVVAADWETEARTRGHDYGYVRCEGGEWVMIPGRRDAARVEYHLTVAPGVTSLGLYPEFSYTECAEFVRSAEARGALCEVIGKSRDKRDIWMLSLPSPCKKAARFFLQARDHAYETAGSFCAQGIVDFLLSDDPLAQYLRVKFDFSIVPMTNVDGVYNGMSRLTHERGADMNRVHTRPDAAHDTLISAIDRVRPDVHMNIHNWTGKFMDGLLANDASIAEKIQTHMPPDHKHHKRLYVQTTLDFLRSVGLNSTPPKHMSWKNYCLDRFGAIGVNFEFPWFSLSPDEMRAKGVRALTALALAAVEERGL